MERMKQIQNALATSRRHRSQRAGRAVPSLASADAFAGGLLVCNRVRHFKRVGFAWSDRRVACGPVTN